MATQTVKVTHSELSHEMQDGVTFVGLADDKMAVTNETRKGKDGTVVETGVVKRQALYKASLAELRDGGGIQTVGPDGSIRMLAEVRYTERYVDAETLAQEQEAARIKRFVPELRKRLGLSKSKQAVEQRDKLTVGDISEFILGNKALLGKRYDSLPPQVQRDVQKAQADAAKKANGAPKVASPTQLAELAALAAKEGKPLPPEWFEQLETLKARQAKAKAAARVEAPAAA